MAFDAASILQNITDDPDVAKNHHMHAVPPLRQKIRDLLDVATSLKKCEDRGDENIENLILEIDADIGKYATILTKFFETWPPASTENILDTTEEVDKFPAEWWSIPLSQSLPSVPLVCYFRTGTTSKTAHVLFYKHPETGEMFKVPNIWYNQPDKRTLKYWSKKYEEKISA